ncbi:carboxy terminal-processing peptidase [Lacinutrix salivirga]
MTKYKLALLTYFVCVGFTFAQKDTLFCKQVAAIQKVVKENHYKAKPNNDSLSKGVFGLFLKYIDVEKNYFHQSDIEFFNSDELLLDNYLQTNTCTFLDKYTTKLQQRVSETKSILSNLKNETFDYSGKDTIRFTKTSLFNYFKSDKSVKRYWNKNIRSKILESIVDESDNFDSLQANFLALEKITKPKIIQNELCKIDEFEKQLGSLDRFVKEAFLNAYVHYHDANSSFFNYSEKTQFENSLSSNALTFGLLTDKNSNGDIIITFITPGSPADKNGNFSENDILKSVSSNGDTLETLCLSNNDILSFLNEESHSTAHFKIKKENGDLKTITLTKGKTKVRQNDLTGFLIGEDSQIGYINIPSFYTNDDSIHGLGLTHDIAKELYKLQKEKIEGLILDLRFNGGGSMLEAAELSGMFIDKGPLAILRYKNDEHFTIRDPKRGTFFNKPIVVLINNYSASASEFFASVMQDYNRAIIVGSPSHGKSSAQTVIPLSTTEDLGFCKLTIEAFYRVTGKSHQSLGVIPDIILPSPYDNFKTSEKFEKYALKNDTISVKLKHKPYSKLEINNLITQSKKRVDSSIDFSLTKRVNKHLIDNYFGIAKSYPITLERVQKRKDDYYDKWNKLFENEPENSLKIQVKNTKSTQEKIGFDDGLKEENDFKVKELRENIYIHEAYNILKDYLNLNKPN